MKKPRKLLAARVISSLLLVVAMTGCHRNAEKSSKAGFDFIVETLFTQDGCTVYRFYDGGYARYFTNCSGSTIYDQYYGKGQSRPDGVTGGRP